MRGWGERAGVRVWEEDTCCAVYCCRPWKATLMKSLAVLSTMREIPSSQVSLYLSSPNPSSSLFFTHTPHFLHTPLTLYIHPSLFTHTPHSLHTQAVKIIRAGYGDDNPIHLLINRLHSSIHITPTALCSTMCSDPLEVYVFLLYI